MGGYDKHTAQDEWLKTLYLTLRSLFDSDCDLLSFIKL